MASPAGLSPSSCAIKARSSPSPALAVPSRSLPINSRHLGRRSLPSNAVLASRAKPICSARSARAATRSSSVLDSMRQLHRSQLVHTIKQQFQLRDDSRDLVQFALQTLLSEPCISCPGLDDLPRAEAEPQQGRRLRAIDANRLSEKAASPRNLVGACAITKQHAGIPRQGAIEKLAVIGRDRHPAPADHERKDRRTGKLFVVAAARGPAGRDRSKRG